MKKYTQYLNKVLNLSEKSIYKIIAVLKKDGYLYDQDNGEKITDVHFTSPEEAEEWVASEKLDIYIEDEQGAKDRKSRNDWANSKPIGGYRPIGYSPWS